MYRRLGAFKQLTAAFQHAVAARPTDENMAKELFACHVRENNSRQQQATALRMYKAFKSPQYMSWVSLGKIQDASTTSAAKAVMFVAGVRV